MSHIPNVQAARDVCGEEYSRAKELIVRLYSARQDRLETLIKARDRLTSKQKSGADWTAASLFFVQGDIDRAIATFESRSDNQRPMPAPANPTAIGKSSVVTHRIFMSHIHQEAQVAKLLRGWLETTFLGQVAVFTSSDDECLPRREMA